MSDYALSERSLKWVIHSIHSRAVVRSVRQLLGGTSSLILHLSLEVEETVQEVVLRLFDNTEWLLEEPDAAHHEAECLRWAAKAGLPTPQLIACDVTGSECDMPAVLMTWIEGRVQLEPTDLKSWVNGLAETLAAIHSVEANDFPWIYSPYIDVASPEKPSWSNVPQLWDAAIRIVQGPQPAAEPCFIHRDYHPGNVLWIGEKISGVVDWANGCRGPAAIDVGHCRRDLALLHGIPAADAFLSAYMLHAGERFRYDPYWDLLSLMDTLFGSPTVDPGWEAFGMNGLTDEMMRKRTDEYMISLLNRSSESGLATHLGKS
ncbi:phosphotransferase family protein [Paenibacillus sp. UNC451MF]|uniref:phosphotransferase family protein n=1 Tax=Paenibacillus sp. UNC451MF TaxID=1449063 RepID=UPI00068D709D|nr:aminoglycoside phosphotransferase family protein [Paenibacillus sp. UNC451MF]